MGSSIQKVLFH